MPVGTSSHPAHPTGGPSAWTITKVESNALYKGTRPNAGSGFGYQHGNYLSDPHRRGISLGSSTNVDGGYRLLGMSCLLTVLCVATDLSGDVVVGAPPPTVTRCVDDDWARRRGETSVSTSPDRACRGPRRWTSGRPPATIVGSCTDTHCDVVAPPGAAGPVVVTVTTPAGMSSSTPTSANTYTYAIAASPTPTTPSPPARICDTRAAGPRRLAGATALGPGGILTVTAPATAECRPRG